MQQNFLYPPPQYQYQQTYQVNNYRPPPQPYSPQQFTPYQQTYLPLQQRNERIMYKSTIQPSTVSSQNSSGLGLGRLQSMGRFIKQQKQEPIALTENIPVIQAQKSGPLSFRPNRPERPKMACSVIFFNKNSQGSNNFPPFNSSSKIEKVNGTSGGLESLMNKARTVKEEEVVDGQEQKRESEGINVQYNQVLQGRIQNNIVNMEQSYQGKAIVSGSSLNFQGQKNFKQFQFYRNTSASNQKQQVNVKQKDLQVVTPLPISRQAPANQLASYELKIAGQNGVLNKQQKMVELITESKSYAQTQINNHAYHPQQVSETAGMFKKKNPYLNSSQQEKTDQNLLKILGITLKSPRQPVLAPKAIDNNKMIEKQPIKPIDWDNGHLKLPTAVVSSRPKSISNSPRKFTKADFKIGKKMGKGQFGQVMLVQHRQTGFLCGMKVMNKKQIKMQRYQNQIARELSIQFYLSHRNVAPLYGYFQDEENVYLLVQFCTDGQLLEMLRKNRRMEQAEVSPIIREICQGLDYIHKEEIIHRDVKPENILFNFGTVKISDFGWAVHNGKGMRKTISGSPLYYSPEMVEEVSYDQKIDLWSIGMMTYQCLLGKIPFRIYSQLDLNRIVSDQINFPQYVDVSDEAKDFILKIMKKKPQERMEMRQIFKHPFITRYMREKRVAGSVLDEFRSVLDQ